MSTTATNIFLRAARLGCIALALSLAACGGDDSGAPAAPSAAATQQPWQSPGSSESPESSGKSSLDPPAAIVGSKVEANPGGKSNDGLNPQAGAPTHSANRPPRIAGTPTQSAPPGKTYEFRPTALDPDGDVLTYSIAGKPNWATFSEETGELRGIPGNGHIGTYDNIAISASDGHHTVSLEPFRIEVNDGKAVSITLNWLPPTESASGKPLRDLAGYKIYWGSRHGDYSNQVTIKSPGVASYVLERLTPGTYYIVLTAFNSLGEESGFSNVISNAL